MASTIFVRLSNLGASRLYSSSFPAVPHPQELDHRITPSKYKLFSFTYFWLHFAFPYDHALKSTALEGSPKALVQYFQMTKASRSFYIFVSETAFDARLGERETLVHLQCFSVSNQDFKNPPALARGHFEKLCTVFLLHLQPAASN